jgi:ATP-dependent Clp protease ATP-binding subunit ClpC
MMADAPSFRVYLTEHHDGRKTGILMRHRESWLDHPPPSGYGRTDEEVLAELEAHVLVLRAQRESLERYLWEETFQTRRVAIEVHPRTMVKTLAVIGHRVTPLRLWFAWSKLESGARRVMLPRWGWWSLFEDLDDVPPVLESLVGGALHGQDPRWLYEFREQGEERVIAWAPSRLMELRASPDEADRGQFPELERVADEWVAKAKRRKLPLVVGEDDRTDMLTRLLTSGPEPILLVGPEGVGKTALVRRVAARLARATRAPRLWSTSAERILAGMVYLGMWQERGLSLVRELSEDGDYLHGGRLTSLVRPLGGGGSLLEALSPAIVGREIGFLAECSEHELVHCRRVAPSFVDACRLVRVHPPPHAELRELMHTYQMRRRSPAVIDAAGIARAVRYLDRFVPGTAFPGKAFSFLDWLERETPRERTIALDPSDVTREVSRYTGVPVALISDDHAATGESIAHELRESIIGQDGACAIAGRVLARFKAGMADPERPLGALLFVGPTGVGKTELAKQLARTMFGSEERMARFDMAEYYHRGAARRLLEVGDGAKSLATRLAAQPLSLVLLDEIEKAHPEVHDLLLAILGEGRLTDVDGRLVDARMALFVMTSNLGASDAAPVGFGEALPPSYDRAVRAAFRPELFGRFDHVVSFRHLHPTDVERIVDLELAKVKKRRGFARKDIALRVTPEARAWLAARGYHREWGARPLRRLIEETVVAKVAVKLAKEPALAHRELVLDLIDDVPDIR